MLTRKYRGNPSNSSWDIQVARKRNTKGAFSSRGRKTFFIFKIWLTCLFDRHHQFFIPPFKKYIHLVLYMMLSFQNKSCYTESRHPWSHHRAFSRFPLVVCLLCASPFGNPCCCCCVSPPPPPLSLSSFTCFTCKTTSGTNASKHCSCCRELSFQVESKSTSVTLLFSACGSGRLIPNLLSNHVSIKVKSCFFSLRSENSARRVQLLRAEGKQ